MEAASNLLGVDVCAVNNLNVELLAPGTAPGRFTMFTDKAIERIAKEKLFNQEIVHLKVNKK